MRSFVDARSSSKVRKLFEKMHAKGLLRVRCCNNAKCQPFPTEPLLMALLFSLDKMINWLTKQISKHELNNHNNKEVKETKQKEGEEELGREIYT